MNQSAFKFGGVYPGSGVAAGGQQGRMASMHGGVTGAARGGRNPGASQLRPGSAPIPVGFTPADFQKLLASLLQTTPMRKVNR